MRTSSFFSEQGGREAGKEEGMQEERERKEARAWQEEEGKEEKALRVYLAELLLEDLLWETAKTICRTMGTG